VQDDNKRLKAEIESLKKGRYGQFQWQGLMYKTINYALPSKYTTRRIEKTLVAIASEFLPSSPSNNDFKSEYKQNAFLALLYLFTFRAINKTFCQNNSLEIQQASRVVEHFKSYRIMSQFVSREKSLNQFF
jgi:hypothetical protein